jgi:hypothetical protein
MSSLFHAARTRVYSPPSPPPTRPLLSRRNDLPPAGGAGERRVSFRAAARVPALPPPDDAYTAA